MKHNSGLWYDVLIFVINGIKSKSRFETHLSFSMYSYTFVVVRIRTKKRWIKMNDRGPVRSCCTHVSSCREGLKLVVPPNTRRKLLPLSLSNLNCCWRCSTVVNCCSTAEVLWSSQTMLLLKRCCCCSIGFRTLLLLKRCNNVNCCSHVSERCCGSNVSVAQTPQSRTLLWLERCC